LPPATRESWREISEALARPEFVGELDDDRFAALVERLRHEGALPLIAGRCKESPGFSLWTAAKRHAVALELAAGKAAGALRSEELGRILKVLGDAGLHPVLLKGSDLAHRYYRASYHRPMVDIDLYFPAPDEALKAQAQLGKAGYMPQRTLASEEGKPWGLQHQLPALCHAVRGHLVEIHVGLLYAPEDRRSQRMKGLSEALERVEVEGCPVLVLQPEANVVYTLAHMFEHHSAEPPRFVALMDVAAILGAETGHFRWPFLQELALSAELARPTVIGLAASREFLSSEVPKAVIKALWAVSERTATLSPKDAPTHHAFAAVWNAGRPADAAREIFRQVFPAPTYMRARYLEWAGWPLPLLYPRRWLRQARRLMSYVWERAAPSARPRTPDKNEERS
jgi:hypothetical protein